MIKIEQIQTYGWAAAIRGMRNPLNSWDRSDSEFNCPSCDDVIDIFDRTVRFGPLENGDANLGPNDYDLAKRLAKAGPEHAKYLRMINVTMDITAPLYWWKEFDTYKVGTVANSCSTIHKIHAKEFTLDDFSYEHLFDYMNNEADTDCYIDELESLITYESLDIMKLTIKMLNKARELYLIYQEKAKAGNQFAIDHAKEYWWKMIQLLPSSYNQKRTVQLNYAVLANIYRQRKDHKLDEWRKFCKMIETLPYSELVTLKFKEDK